MRLWLNGCKYVYLNKATHKTGVFFLAPKSSRDEGQHAGERSETEANRDAERNLIE